MPVDTEGRQTLLGMCGKYGSQIDSTRTLCAVEAPNSFGVMRIHVHCLRTVAPARGDGDGRAHTLTLEFLGTGSTLGNTTDGGICNHTLHGRTVAVAQVLGYQLGNSLSQCHCFLFKAFADATLATIDSRTNSDFGIFHDIVVLFTHILYIR